VFVVTDCGAGGGGFKAAAYKTIAAIKCVDRYLLNSTENVRCVSIGAQV
jgi:hypothetical protein